MDVEGAQRLDSFPYRHRVRDIMSAPVVTCTPDCTIADAARLMVERKVSSVVIVPAQGGAMAGILTERDVLRAAAGKGLERTVAAVMSHPVHSVAADAFVHVAIGRMDRLGFRHLPVVDRNGTPVGMVTSRALLKLRAQTALALGDEVQAAGDAAALGAAVGRLPALAAALRADLVPSRDVARVISGVIRDATARAADLAEAAMESDGRGAAPARYAVLVLGSAGRGESLLAPDQDNAIVHDGQAADDGWFADLGRQMCAILDGAGIPYCRGKVMAQEPQWRRSLDGWRTTIDGWVATHTPEGLLNVDIFYDFRAVGGDAELVKALRDHATRSAGGARLFLRLLAANLETMTPPVGAFGRLRSDNGRVDLKRGGLLPIVSAARLVALKRASPARSTSERLAAGGLTEADRKAFDEAHAFLLDLVLDQQIADIAAGIAPSYRVALSRLDRPARRHLKEALRQADAAREAVRDVLTDT